MGILGGGIVGTDAFLSDSVVDTYIESCRKTNVLVRFAAAFCISVKVFRARLELQFTWVFGDNIKK